METAKRSAGSVQPGARPDRICITRPELTARRSIRKNSCGRDCGSETRCKFRRRGRSGIPTKNRGDPPEPPRSSFAFAQSVTQNSAKRTQLLFVQRFILVCRLNHDRRYAQTNRGSRRNRNQREPHDRHGPVLHNSRAAIPSLCPSLRRGIGGRTRLQRGWFRPVASMRRGEGPRFQSK